MSALAGHTLAGTGPLLRASLKYEKKSFAPWIVIATALSVSSVVVYPWVYPEQADRVEFAAVVGSNPALSLIFGPAFDLSTSDGFNAWRALALGGFLTALGAISIVVKATRGQEDSGQAELLASGVMGRGTRLFTGMCLALICSVLVGAISGIATALCGGEWENSLLLCATFTATGWMFTGIAAIAAQLGGDAHSANTLAVSVLGVLFVLRGFTYSIEAPQWTVWVNPLGWMTETRPATENHWWPLLLAAAFTAVALVSAFILDARRDFGQGATPPRPGPARGKVHSPLRLALRINTGSMIAWACAFGVLGVVFGYFATSVEEILRNDSAVSQILAAGATTPDALISEFIVTILSMVGIIASVSGVQMMIKIRHEELEDRLEPLLATAISRTRYLGSNVVIAMLAPAAYVLIAGTVIAVFVDKADIGMSLGEVLLQAVTVIPAVWTVVALAVAVVGARPMVLLAAWAGVLISFALTILGPPFNLWDWILAINPYWHIPNVVNSGDSWAGLLWISVITVAFLALGFAGFRRRDLAQQ
ncbi:ABC transporter permease [Corynebacterium ammoniagenes]|uniref:ABC transporter permease n=1 Tax=Corynebacterium ammoniagenes TaxID=1697 RepID=UPI001459AC54|nr:ABC transporter permease [Corynebacterium ammoniagenes]NMF32819.1 ABC transporter permease [Corynebacterium ammoniagenes]